MKVEYLPSFLKDLKALKSAPVFEQVKAIVFEEIPNLTDLQTIINLKKLKGDDNAYRLRVGDYRIGFYNDIKIGVANDIATFGIEFEVVKKPPQQNMSID